MIAAFLVFSRLFPLPGVTCAAPVDVTVDGIARPGQAPKRGTKCLGGDGANYH